MLLAQFLEDIRSGPGAACFVIGISLANAFYRFPVILLLPFEIVGKDIIEGGNGVLAVPLGIFVQLGLAFRLERIISMPSR
jgi:hypothetical protein